MTLPEQPAEAPLPPSRPIADIHADSDVPLAEKPTVRLPPPEEQEKCRNIHCACHHF